MADTTSAADVVRRFIALWSRSPLDPEAFGAFFDAESVYHNIPMEPVVGRDAIVAAVAGFSAGVTGAEFQLRHLVADGGIVLTERVDIFNYADGTRVALPVMGTFEVRDDGVITAWRDYFDVQQFMSQLPSAGG